ncbi:MAG TPA: molybdopterin-dependent oxidoreductase [Candidatus Limnocylindria bacterium]|nr:molybdopterin-dependent oxidoreductase [Candidatus Limnocylindria bacterium]
MDLQHSDAVVFMGSNMAECHPVGFKWPMKAKARGATLIHVDPRFTRTSAMCDLYVPMRSGTDIVFLGALINYVIENKKYLEEYVINFTNAGTLINAGFKDTDDPGQDGFFSGYNPQTRAYDRTTWQYQTDAAPVRVPEPTTPTGEQSDGQASQPGVTSRPGTLGASSVAGADFAALIANRLPGVPKTDISLSHPNSVFQILRRHYARYTPEMVERVCGTPKELFLKVAETITANSGRDRTTAFVYAVGWTQHTTGVQLIRTAGMLQALLGNIGRPGGGIMALRGHATIQGCTDIASLYNIHPGYLSTPDATKAHDTLRDYILTETQPTSFWSNTPAYMVSQLKAWFGDAATAQNDYLYDTLPKMTGDHSHLPVFVEMSEGKIKGMIVTGQNPATSINSTFQRKAMASLEWLVVLDSYETETAAFWKDVAGADPKAVRTEVFFIPAAHIAEKDGSMTQTQRTIQWHDKAADPPGDARSDLFFWYDLGKRLKRRYANSNAPRDLGIKHMTLDYDPEPAEVAEWKHKDEPSAFKIFKEINGFTVQPKRDLATAVPLNSFANLQANGTTACGAWIYTGMLQVVSGQMVNRARMQPGKNDGWVSPNWGWAWPGNRHQLYNRASADAQGRPWSERKKFTYWDAAARTWKNDSGEGIDFTPTKAPETPANPRGIGIAFHSGAHPFLLKTDGKAWLFAPSGTSDGPLPTHYEPWESPVKNLLYKQDRNPVAKIWEVGGNKYNEFAGAEFPTVITTYRLTEHHLSGTMSRWLPWLAELQPELFCEMSPELAREKGIANGDYVNVISSRATTRARALVTKRLRPFTIDGKTVHQVGMPWHWGYMGIATSDVANNVTALVADPNVTIHEGKAFTCRIERAADQRSNAPKGAKV